ncbi:hypothetical protein F5B20DRAFT_527818 [Whalleya microplaca]|nr:hypothetical protein F5B20DRAFT_527818 [Whalleya microplaca]
MRLIESSHRYNLFSPLTHTGPNNKILNTDLQPTMANTSASEQNVGDDVEITKCVVDQNSVLVRQNDCPFPFLQLCPELRLEIYKHLFYGTQVVVAPINPPFTQRDDWAKTTKPLPHSLALLSTCRQVYNEIGSSWMSQITTEMSWLGIQDLERVPWQNIRYVCFTQPVTCNYSRFINEAAKILKRAPGLDFEQLTITGYVRYEERLKDLTVTGSLFKATASVLEEEKTVFKKSG